MPKALARGPQHNCIPARSDPAVAAKQVRITNRKPTARLNRRLNPLTKITGARASSLSPSRDTPTVIQPGPDGLSRNAAEAAWHAVTPSIAGTPHVRISRDGGRTYPARHARPLPAESSGQPCTVPVYDPGSATGRMLALDLDPARTRARPRGYTTLVSAVYGPARLVTIRSRAGKDADRHLSRATGGALGPITQQGPR